MSFKISVIIPTYLPKDYLGVHGQSRESDFIER